MFEKEKMTRRVMLGNAIAASTILAGCSSSGEADTSNPTDTGTDSPTETPTATETKTPTEEPTTVENFSYPSGISQDGIVPSKLFKTHRASIIDAGSATVTVDQATDRGDYASAAELTTTYSSNGLIRSEEKDSITETVWSPSSEDVGYVQMDTGFDQRYRIDNQEPQPQKVLQLTRFKRLLTGGQWSKATKVVETDEGESAVVYEAAGIANPQNLLWVVYGNEVTAFEATISVTESGYLSELSYDLTVKQDGKTIQQQATATVGKLGETTVEEPSWTATAQENGVRFSSSVSDDKKAIVLELVNGEVPSDTRISLSSKQYGSATLTQAISAGDTLYTSFSESGEVLLGVNEIPSESTELEDFVYVDIRNSQFTLFREDITL